MTFSIINKRNLSRGWELRRTMLGLMLLFLFAGSSYDVEGSGVTDVASLNKDALNLNGPLITYSPLANTLCTTNRLLNAEITSTVGVNTNPGSKPRIYFRKATNVNALGITNDNTTDGWKFTETSNTGSPFSFSINYSQVFGGVTVGETVQYFVVAQDLNSTPNVEINNGIFTSPQISVALTASAFPLSGSINQYQVVSGGLSGTVNVGTGQTYLTLTGSGGLFSVLNSGGLNGNLTANITANLTEDGSVALNSLIYGCSGSSSLIIKPLGNYTVSGSNAGSIIKLNGADNITIDGSVNGSSSRNLTIINNFSGPSSAVIWIASASPSDGANNNTIKSCIISGNSATTTMAGINSGNNLAVGTAAVAANSNNTFLNNFISKAQYGILLTGKSPTTPDQNVNLVGNILGSALSGDGFGVSGISVRFQQAATIAGNNVQNITNNGSATLTSLNLSDCVGSTVYGNKFHFMNYSGPGTARVYGIHSASSVFNSQAIPSVNTFVNNLIYDLTSGSTSSAWSVSGINNEGGYGDKYYFNSVSLTGNLSSGTGGSAAFSIGNSFTNASSSSGGFDIRNNIFSVTGSSTSTPILYSHYTTLSSYAGSILDYNDLYVSITGTATGKIGHYNNSDQADLFAWRGTTGQEGNSISSNPLFSNQPILQPTAGSLVLGAGTPIPGVITDIAGDTRNPIPSIGAYESAQPGICPYSNTSFVSDLTGSTYQWQLDDGTGLGFIDLSNNANYSGVNSGTLTISNPLTSFNNNHYRARVNGTLFSSIFTLKIVVVWIGVLSSDWFTPANWSCNAIPDQFTDVQINAVVPFNLIVTSNVACKSLLLKQGSTVTVNPGFIIDIKGH